MISSSYTNLRDLASGNFPDQPKIPSNVSSANDNQSPVLQNRMIVVHHLLPLKAEKENGNWSFMWNHDSLSLQLKDGLPKDMEVLYVGSLNVEIEPQEQEQVAELLFNKFKCVSAFLPPDLKSRFDDGFCKRQLWPLLHHVLPFSAAYGGVFDKSLWESYVAANKLFSSKVIEIINPDEDYVWIHDYHLMVLPMFLRIKFNRLRMGFFLHSPFPSSEIYGSLPVREEILKALLNCDLIGFHTFDYARHFLSCCSRILGLEYQSNKGYIRLEYYGRNVGIKIMPLGIHMGRVQSVMRSTEVEDKVIELKKRFNGRIVLLGIDDMDIFKGINLKLLAMEHMLKQQMKWRGKVVLVQIVNPARDNNPHTDKLSVEIQESCERINEEFGTLDYQPVIYIDSPISTTEKVAYFHVTDCVVVTTVRDGMNLIPYEYTVCRQGLDSSVGPKQSVLVVSEFIGCSPSLSGAIRVNPWNVEATSEALNKAISMGDNEKELRHEKHFRYVSSHDVIFWSRSFWQDLERICADHFKKICWGMGINFDFRVMALDPNFKKLSIPCAVLDYKQAKSRVILLDYDGTLMPQNSNKALNPEVITLLDSLCSDPKNSVFIVSGKGRDKLGKWFSSCKNIGIAAEHGYIIKWPGDEEWKKCDQSFDLRWMGIVEPVMQQYVDCTQGSSIEMKESALVWQYRDADSRFGSIQAKEMLDHLENVLANEAVAVKSGYYIVEVKPQGVSKGFVSENIFTLMAKKGKQVDFVLCIGDDRSDEDMFEAISEAMSKSKLSENASVYACTVGQKPSMAKYYLDNTSEVTSLLQSLTEGSSNSDL